MNKNIFFSGVSSISIFAFQFFLLALVAQIFSKSSFGLVSIFASLSAFFLIFTDFGVNNFVITRKELSKTLIKKVSLIVIFISLLMSFLIISSTALYGVSGKIFYGAIFLAVNVFLISLIRVPRAVIHKSGKFKELAIIDFCSRAITISLLIYIYLSYDLAKIDAITLYFVPITFLNFILIIFTNLIFYKTADVREGDFKADREFFNFTTPLFINSIINFLIQNIDLFLIAFFLGLEAAGAFTILKQLILRPIFIISPAITNVLIRDLANANHAKINLAPIYNKSVVYITSLSFLIIFTVNILLPEIINLFFGEKWLDIQNLVFIFSFYGVLRASFIPIGSLLSVLNKNDIGLYYTIAQSLILIPLIAFFSFYANLQTLIYVMLIYQISLSFAHYGYFIDPLLKIGYLNYHKYIILFFLILFVSSYV